ncbi:REP element-mobilizing transposase RayT [Maribacter caenipelagi]|uniref:REP element-mobilizing transposase RayT n=1 Tax=Maribacter caenipelagi TaxID=1447781 RepID=A0A4R7DMY9_9FLAO|nr:transposase [Maribacter caenipelagi]TDS20876.1 REP element-mobilizing transposase RayT [Maribacter caenipelagi]
MFNNEGYKIRDQTKPHFLTFTVVDWVDVFTRKRYKDLLIENLGYCIKNKGMVIFGYVIMSNHIHLIIQSNDGKLSDLVRDFKKHTAKVILASIHEEPESRREWMLERFETAAKKHSRNKKYQFWKYGNHPEEVYSDKFLWSKLNYIHMNPVRAGLVVKASNYSFSSATNYVHGQGVLQITKVDNPVIDVLKSSAFLKSMSW